MQIKSKNMCPFLAKKCIAHDCAIYIKVRGMDNNTGKEIEEWACSIAWMPTLLIESSNMQRHTTASVDSFRNEMVKANNISLAMQQGASVRRIEE